MTVHVNAVFSAGAFRVVAEFSAAPGVTALFGPSGAGKSLTLAGVAGLLRPVEGAIEIDGRVVADVAANVHVPTQERALGMVFQHAALLSHRSPLDNVAIAIRDAPNRATRRERAHEWLERVHAGHLSDAPVRTLSGGEQQRVALARALAGTPRTLLLDEPFSALDLAHRTMLRELVRSLVDEHRITALLVTHDLADITDLADHVVVFEPGRTVAQQAIPNDARSLAELLGLTSQHEGVRSPTVSPRGDRDGRVDRVSQEES